MHTQINTYRPPSPGYLLCVFRAILISKITKDFLGTMLVDFYLMNVSLGFVAKSLSALRKDIDKGTTKITTIFSKQEFIL